MEEIKWPAVTVQTVFLASNSTFKPELHGKPRDRIKNKTGCDIAKAVPLKNGDQLPIDIIKNMYEACNTDSLYFPPTELYNEGWLLRIILHWFSTNKIVKHPINQQYHITH